MKKFALFLLLLSFITTPAFATQFNVYADSKDYAQNFDVAPFNKIDVDGVNAIIETGPRKPYVRAKGDSLSLKYLNVFVKKNTLYLQMKPDYHVKNGRLSVFICNPELIDLRQNGAGQVTAKNLQGQLNVVKNGSGSMKIDGNIILENLTYNGSGPLEMYWVNSSNVKVVGNGNGKISLAGVVGLLDLNLHNHTLVDAKYLHAERVFAKTTDYARADIWAKENSTTLARDYSNIYYYNDSGFVGAYMAPPGNSLRMVGIDTGEAAPATAAKKDCCY